MTIDDIAIAQGAITFVKTESVADYNKRMAAQWEKEAQAWESGAACGMVCNHLAKGCREIATTFN